MVAIDGSAGSNLSDWGLEPYENIGFFFRLFSWVAQSHNIGQQWVWFGWNFFNKNKQMILDPNVLL